MERKTAIDPLELAGWPLLAACPPPELRLLAEVVEPLWVPPGTLLWARGEPVADLALVGWGRIEAWRDPLAPPIPIEPGTLAGGEGFLRRPLARETVRAGTDALLFAIPGEVLPTLRERAPEAWLALCTAALHHGMRRAWAGALERLPAGSLPAGRRERLTPWWTTLAATSGMRRDRILAALPGLPRELRRPLARVARLVSLDRGSDPLRGRGGRRAVLVDEGAVALAVPDPGRGAVHLLEAGPGALVGAEHLLGGRSPVRASVRRSGWGLAIDAAGVARLEVAARQALVAWLHEAATTCADRHAMVEAGVEGIEPAASWAGAGALDLLDPGFGGVRLPAARRPERSDAGPGRVRAA